jgi:uncharacterized protein (DUF2147 family)
MNKLFLFLFVGLLSYTSFIFPKEVQIHADKVIGVWLTQDKDAHIEIYKQQGKYYGKLIWGKDMFEADGVTSKKDKENPDKALKNRPLQNLVLLTDFVFRDDKWEDGKIYDAKSGKTYSCVMKFNGENLKITGYIGFSWIGKTVEWTRK